jgi:hypothetical protein
LELFLRLDRTPKRARADEWRAQSRQLNEIVDLDAHATGALSLWANLLDVGPPPVDVPGTYYRADWEICHDMREQLLAAAHAAGLLDQPVAGIPPAAVSTESTASDSVP